MSVTKVVTIHGVPLEDGISRGSSDVVSVLYTALNRVESIESVAVISVNKQGQVTVGFSRGQRGTFLVMAKTLEETVWAADASKDQNPDGDAA